MASLPIQDGGALAPGVVVRHRPTGSVRKCAATILAALCRLEAGVTTRTAGILPAGVGAGEKPALHPKGIPSGAALLTL